MTPIYTKLYESIDGGIPRGKTGALYIAKKSFFGKPKNLPN
jgi:hypothetical protein